MSTKSGTNMPPESLPPLTKAERAYARGCCVLAADLLARLERAEAAIRSVPEWARLEGEWCVFCVSPSDVGHDPDCIRAALEKELP